MGIALLCHTRKQYAAVGNTKFVEKVAPREQGQHGYCLRKGQPGAGGTSRPVEHRPRLLGLSHHSQHGKQDRPGNSSQTEPQAETVGKYSSNEASLRPGWKSKQRSGPGRAAGPGRSPGQERGAPWPAGTAAKPDTSILWYSLGKEWRLPGRGQIELQGPQVSRNPSSLILVRALPSQEFVTGAEWDRGVAAP